MPTSTSQPDGLLSILGQALEKLLNRLLQLEEDALHQVQSLEGKAITLEFSGLNLAMRIQVTGGKLTVGPAHEGDNDLYFRATPVSLLALAFKNVNGSMPSLGKVEISGDANLARQLEEIVKQFKPDFEEGFAQIFGDVMGYQLAHALRQAFIYMKNIPISLVEMTAEYLREESRDLIASAEMEQFTDEADDLRQRSERLEKRINQFKAGFRTASP